ncbi:MAG: DedA family protein [Ignavibacteriaceae bacterium]
MNELLKQFPGIAPYIKTLAPYIQHYGYWAIFFSIYLEDFGLPLPGETVLIICSLFAILGKLNLVYVGILGFMGAVFGDNTGFMIGRYGGKKLVLKWGKYLFITAKRLNKFENFFTKYGGKIVTVARFVQGLRQFNGIIAGISEMKWKKFLIFNLIGAGLWVGFWIGLASYLSNRKELLTEFIKKSEYILPLIIITPFIVEGLYRLIKKIKNKRQET